jgi:hypothetical protein
MYGPFATAQSSYIETTAAGSGMLKIFSLVSTDRRDGVDSIAFSEHELRGAQTTPALRTMSIFRIEGYDYVHVGSNKQSFGANWQLAGPPTEVFYASPLPRDKAFSLDAGGTHTTHYNVRSATGPDAGSIPSAWTTTAHYLGQQKLLVQGVQYDTCKFQFTDSRFADGVATLWYAKSPEPVRGFVVRMEARIGATQFTRELLSASIGSFFAP